MYRGETDMYQQKKGKARHEEEDDSGSATHIINSGVKTLLNVSLLIAMFSLFLVAAPSVYSEEEGKEMIFSGHFRVRGEYRNNKDMNSAQPDEVFFINSRLRVGIGVNVSESVFIKGTIQDSRIFGSTGRAVTSTAPLETVNFTATNARGAFETLDLSEAFVLIKRDVGVGLLQLKLGRQRVAYGEHRILGTFDWSNVGNSFDGGKISFRTSEREINSDVFGFILRENAVQEGPVEMPTGLPFFLRKRAYLLGIYNSVKVMDGIKGDLYFLYLRDEQKQNFAGKGFESVTQGRVPSPADIFAPGGRFEGEIKAGDMFSPIWAFEGVYEFGQAWSDKLNAFAFSGRVGTKINVQLKPKIFVEYNIASGTSQEDKQNKVRRTFYNFFPTNHIHYGYADLFSWKNMQGIRGHLSFSAGNFRFLFDYWKFTLFSEYDWWYHAGQAPFLNTELPYPSKDAGSEIDLTLKYKSGALGVMAGYSIFLPGELPKKLGRQDVQHWMFLQVLVKF